MRKELIAPISMWKAAIRKEALRKRDALSQEEVAALSGRCVDVLLASAALNPYETIFLYVSHRNEMDAGRLLPLCQEWGKRVAYPKVMNQGRRAMEFFAVGGEDDLEVGFWGVREPNAGGTPILPDHAAILVPGLAFTKDGSRIGYGGGYYDGYLNRYKGMDIFTIGVAYEWQLMRELPMEANDVRVDAIATEEALYLVRDGESHKDK